MGRYGHGVGAHGPQFVAGEGPLEPPNAGLREYGGARRGRTDPEAEEDFARRSERLERDNGQTQWWPAGESVPERGPELVGAD